MLHGLYMLWGGSRSTKPCVFPCKVAVGDDERYLVCAAGAAAVVPDAIGSSSVFCNNGCSCVRSSMRFFCNQSFKKRIELQTQEQPLLQNTEEEPIASGTTAAAPAAHTRYLSSSPAATLHGKTQGFVLRLPPHNIAHATFMQPFQCDLQPELQETHRTTHTGTTIVAEHRGGTNRVRNDRSRTRRTHEVPFIVAYSHFTRKNTRFRAPASSPQHI